MSPFRDDPIITVAIFSTEVEASLARGALEAIGIPAMVPGEHFGAYARYSGALRGFELKVFEQDSERAAVELRRLQIRVVPRSGETDLDR